MLDEKAQRAKSKGSPAEGANSGAADDGLPVPDQKVTQDDVRFAYRLFFGRSPENGAVVDRHVAAMPDVGTLRARFTASPEFIKRNYQALVTPTIRAGFGFQPAPMDIDVSPEQLGKLFEHVQKVWSHLGLDRPHYSVLSERRFRPEMMTSNLKEFRRTGEAEVAGLRQRLNALGVGPTGQEVCIEYGCGVGRVTAPLAAMFQNVIGMDISQPHLDLAREFVEPARRKNIDFQRVADLRRLNIPPHDFFYSRIVLQHNPPPLIAYILRQALGKMRLGGVAVFQLVTHIEGYRFVIDDYLNKMDAIDDQELHAFRQDAVFGILHELGFQPLHVMRDHSVTGLDRVSMQFVARRESLG